MKKSISKKEKRTAREVETEISPPSPSIFRFFPLVLILLVGALSYSNTLHAPFVFDDVQIRENRAIHLDSLSVPRLTRLVKDLFKKGRTVAYASLAINYYFGGFNPFGYHLVNLAIHLLSSILIYLFMKITFSLPSLREHYGEKAREIALLGGLLFVAHPVQTQAVTYIIQRIACMAAMFYMLSLTSYVYGRVAGGRKAMFFYVVSALSALLAFGSKQHTITLPVVMLLYEFFFFLELDFKEHKKKLYLLFIPLVILGITLLNTNWDRIGFDQFEFTMGERVLTELRVVVYYISLLLLPLPSRLNVDYDYQISSSLMSPPSTILSLMIIICLIIIAVRIAAKKPIISFGIFWFLITLAPESTVLPLDIIFEHRLYLPSIGFFMIVSAVWVKFFDNIPQKHRLKSRLISASLLVLLLGWGTYQRNETWTSSLNLWSDVVKKSPRNSRAHNNLCLAYHNLGMLDEALEECNKAVMYNPLFYSAFDNMGRIYLKKEKPDEAIKVSEEAIRLNPDFMPAYNSLGMAYNKKKMYDKAIKYFQETLKDRPSYPPSYFQPNYAESYLNLGHAYQGKGEHDKAMDFYQKANKLLPAKMNIACKQGNAYYNKKEYDEAIKMYNKALVISPDSLAVHNGLGCAYSKKGLYKEAEKEFLRVVQLNPKYSKIHYNLAQVYAGQGLYEKAVLEYKEALAQNPDEAIIYNLLGMAYAKSKRYQEAVEVLKKAIDNNFTGAHKNLGNVYYLLKKYDRAIQEWKQALAVTPKDESLKKALDMAQREMK